MNRDPSTAGANRRACGAQSQGWVIALLAEVEQDEVANRSGSRPLEDGGHELSPLAVREVPPVAEVAGDQEPVTEASACISTSWLNSTPRKSTSARASAMASVQLPVSAMYPIAIARPRRAGFASIRNP